jgi:hypothetical protein
VKGVNVEKWKQANTRAAVRAAATTV